MPKIFNFTQTATMGANGSRVSHPFRPAGYGPLRNRTRASRVVRAEAVRPGTEVALRCSMAANPAEMTLNSEGTHHTHSLAEAYAGQSGEDIPIGGYATTMAVFASSLASMLWLAHRARKLPERVAVRDIAVMGVATHRLARIVSRDRVAIPLRAPFTHYEGSAGAGMVKEAPRGPGLRRVVGSLLVCQFCVGPWVAAGLTAGLLFAPRATRVVSSLFAMVTVSDFLHQAYAGARRWSQ